MRRTAVAAVALLILFPVFAAAKTTGTCLERNTECTLGELLVLDKQASSFNLSREDHIAILLNIITELRRIITNYAATSQLTECVNLKHDLRPGSTDANTGGEVSTLQFFLSNVRAFPERTVTGVYGSLTAQAVFNWQRENAIGDSDMATGVGPQTRQKIRLATCPDLDS